MGKGQKHLHFTGVECPVLEERDFCRPVNLAPDQERELTSPDSLSFFL